MSDSNSHTVKRIMHPSVVCEPNVGRASSSSWTVVGDRKPSYCDTNFALSMKDLCDDIIAVKSKCLHLFVVDVAVDTEHYD